MSQTDSKLARTLLVVTLIPPLALLAFFVGFLVYLFIRTSQDNAALGMGLVLFWVLFMLLSFLSWRWIFQKLTKAGFWPDFQNVKSQPEQTDPDDSAAKG
jgi:hypothetical protein